MEQMNLGEFQDSRYLTNCNYREKSKMSSVALFVRHRANPGKRESVRIVWEKFVKPRVEANSDHLAYYFCYDENDQDAICAFQLFSNNTALDSFMKGEWYSEYFTEVGNYISEKPQIDTASPQWIKKAKT